MVWNSGDEPRVWISPISAPYSRPAAERPSGVKSSVVSSVRPWFPLPERE